MKKHVIRGLPDFEPDTTTPLHLQEPSCITCRHHDRSPDGFIIYCTREGYSVRALWERGEGGSCQSGDNWEGPT